jgi:hypothetical protein
VRLHRPQNITLATALVIDRVMVSDSVNSLKAGDPLLLLFSDDGSVAALRSIRSTRGRRPMGARRSDSTRWSRSWRRRLGT